MRADRLFSRDDDTVCVTKASAAYLELARACDIKVVAWSTFLDDSAARPVSLFFHGIYNLHHLPEGCIVGVNHVIKILRTTSFVVDEP